LAGEGDQQSWVRVLGEGAAKALMEQVEVSFTKTNPELFDPSQPVALGVRVKNIAKL